MWKHFGGRLPFPPLEGGILPRAGLWSWQGRLCLPVFVPTLRRVQRRLSIVGEAPCGFLCSGQGLILSLGSRLGCSCRGGSIRAEGVNYFLSIWRERVRESQGLLFLWGDIVDRWGTCMYISIPLEQLNLAYKCRQAFCQPLYKNWRSKESQPGTTAPYFLHFMTSSSISWEREPLSLNVVPWKENKNFFTNSHARNR